MLTEHNRLKTKHFCLCRNARGVSLLHLLRRLRQPLTAKSTIYSSTQLTKLQSRIPNYPMAYNLSIINRITIIAHANGNPAYQLAISPNPRVERQHYRGFSASQKRVHYQLCLILSKTYSTAINIPCSEQIGKRRMYIGSSCKIPQASHLTIPRSTKWSSGI